MLKRNAHQKFLTEKPVINILVKRIKRPFKINVKRPKVMILRGKVKIKSTGLIKVLIIPRTTPTIIAVVKLFMLTPGKSCAVIKTAKPLTRRLMIICMK